MWERLIGMTKNALKIVLGKSLVSLFELQTIITQIECKLNDRPLTVLSQDIKDLNPLTPSQLLCGHRLVSYPDSVSLQEVKDPTYHTSSFLNKRFLHCTKLLEHFWNRWAKEYLTLLRERYNFIGKEPCRVIKMGDVVLVHENTPKVSWKLGIVITLYPGLDSVVRTVDVRTASGVLCRSVTKLYPLEVQDENFVNTVKHPINECVKSRPDKRSASLKAAEALKFMS